MLILGGSGRLYGAFVGVPVFMLAQDLLAKQDPANWYLGLGIILIGMVMLAPGGILGPWTTHRRCDQSAEAAMIGTATLETRLLNRMFGSNQVITNVDFALRPGDRRALIGPNGAGKTTFVNLLTGRLQPSSGSVLLDGEDITRLGEARRIRLGIGRTFQITSLFPKMSVRENVFLAVAECEGIAGKLFRSVFHYRPQVARARTNVFERVGLSDVAQVPAQLLPDGWSQRLLEIAIALALRPKILLLDEPAAGIPTAESQIDLYILATIPKEIAVLLIDHDMDLVFRFAQQISVLVQGSIREGPPDVIAADPRVRAVYLGETKHGTSAAA